MGWASGEEGEGEWWMREVEEMRARVSREREGRGRGGEREREGEEG